MKIYTSLFFLHNEKNAEKMGASYFRCKIFSYMYYFRIPEIITTATGAPAKNNNRDNFGIIIHIFPLKMYFVTHH